MGLTPDDVMQHPLNLTGQNVLTYASWAITVVVLVVAYRLGRKEGTQFYVVMVLAAMVAAFAEPLYDVMMSLWFYTDPKMHDTFTAFGIPQPIWAHSGYAILYALPAMYVVRLAWAGRLTPKLVWAFGALQLAESCAFEIAGINMGTYTYWGPHAFRIFDYPLVIGVLEAAQVIAFALVAATLRHRMTASWQVVGLFGIFPLTMLGVNFGAGAATILAIHLDDPQLWLTRLAALVSMVAAAGVVRMAIGMIPPPGSQHGNAAGGTTTHDRELVNA